MTRRNRYKSRTNGRRGVECVLGQSHDEHTDGADLFPAEIGGEDYEQNVDVGLLLAPNDDPSACPDGYACIPAESSALGGRCVPTMAAGGDDLQQSTAPLFAHRSLQDGGSSCPAECPETVCSCFDRSNPPDKPSAATCRSAIAASCLDGSYVASCANPDQPEIYSLLGCHSAAFYQCLKSKDFYQNSEYPSSYCNYNLAGSADCTECYCEYWAGQLEAFTQVCSQGPFATNYEKEGNACLYVGYLTAYKDCCDGDRSNLYACLQSIEEAYYNSYSDLPTGIETPPPNPVPVPAPDPSFPSPPFSTPDQPVNDNPDENLVRCPVCPDGSNLPRAASDSAAFDSLKESGRLDSSLTVFGSTCSGLKEAAESGMIPVDTCNHLQAISIFDCGCPHLQDGGGNFEGPPCYLCQSDVAGQPVLIDPTILVNPKDPSSTCGIFEWQAMTSFSPASRECQAMQATAGALCGCPNPPTALCDVGCPIDTGASDPSASSFEYSKILSDVVVGSKVWKGEWLCGEILYSESLVPCSDKTRRDLHFLCCKGEEMDAVPASATSAAAQSLSLGRSSMILHAAPHAVIFLFLFCYLNRTLAI